MAIDISVEDLIRLGDVPKLKCMPPGKDGKRIAISTVYRWALGGTGGVKLETLKVGGSLCTSVDALQRFFEALSSSGVGAGQATTTSSPHESARRRKEIETASKRLEELLNKGKKRSEVPAPASLEARLIEARKNPHLARLSRKSLLAHLEAERRLDEAGI